MTIHLESNSREREALLAVTGRGKGRERRQGPTDMQEEEGERLMEGEDKEEMEEVRVGSDVKEAVTFAGACDSG